MNPKRKNLKRWFSILLTIIFCFTLTPAAALAAPNVTEQQVRSRINEIKAMYPNGSYFSVDGKKCTSSNCWANCNVKAVTKKIGMPWWNDVGADASQCMGFTKFAYYYIFQQSVGGLKSAPTKEAFVAAGNSCSHDTYKNARIGDVLVFRNSAGDYKHYGIFISANENGMTMLNANEGSTNRVMCKEYTYTADYLYNRVEIRRAKNYTVGTTPATTTNTAPAAETVQIMFNGNGGSVSESSRTIKKGSALGSFPKATRSGYTLKGWYSTTTATASSKVTESQKLNGNMTLYAVWSKNATTTTNTTTSAATKTYYVKGTDGTLVMRKGPGSNYGQQTLIPEGASVKVTPSKNSGSWWYVTYNGKSGYSYSKYLTTTAPKAKETQLIKNGTYEIAPNYATNMRLDVSGASKSDGANVQIYKANGTNAQKWKFKHLGNDYYTITCVASGKVLDVKSGNSKPGANVQQWGSNSSNAQIWKVKKADNGSYYLCPKLNEKVCLDAYKGQKTNNTNVTTWTLNNAYNQKWKIF